MVALILEEGERQNLIAPSTIGSIWGRHVVDSLQLVQIAGASEGRTWLDIGTGGGFPGLVVAAVWDGPVILVEPRRRRAEFLEVAAAELGLDNVTVRQVKIEAVRDRAHVFSARAVAPVATLVEASRGVAWPGARWLLPRGRMDATDEAVLAAQGIVFHVEHSVTEEGSRIVVIREEELAR
jgi:16S rRNA (guanine527-N7)-methyltransferase